MSHSLFTVLPIITEVLRARRAPFTNVSHLVRMVAAVGCCSREGWDAARESAWKVFADDDDKAAEGRAAHLVARLIARPATDRWPTARVALDAEVDAKSRAQLACMECALGGEGFVPPLGPRVAVDRRPRPVIQASVYNMLRRARGMLPPGLLDAAQRLARRRLTAMEARREFGVTEEELLRVRYTWTTPARRRSYRLDDILAMCERLFGTEDGMLARMRAEDVLRQERREILERIRSERRHSLSRELAALDLTLADVDAAVDPFGDCERYVNHGGGDAGDLAVELGARVGRHRRLVHATTTRGLTPDDHEPACVRYIQLGVGDPHDIARDMQEERFLCEYTDYPRLRRQAIHRTLNAGRAYDERTVHVEAFDAALSRWSRRQHRLGLDPVDHPALPPSMVELFTQP